MVVEKPNIKEIAEFFRLGLRIGIFAPSTVIQWADSIIMAENKPDISIIEVSLSGAGGLNKTIDSLNEIKGEIRSDYPAKLMLAYCWKKLRTKDWTEDFFSGLLYSLKNASEVSEDVEIALMNLDENLSLAEDGVYGTVKEAMNDIMKFLESFEEYERHLPNEV
jgi:hypothetical protein